MHDEFEHKNGAERKAWLSWITGGGNEVVTLSETPITERVVPRPG